MASCPVTSTKGRKGNAGFFERHRMQHADFY